MPQNRTGSICAPELLLNSTPLATFTHKHSKTNEVSNGMDSSRSTPPTKLEVKSSMASASLSGSTLGVLLPVCLHAVFLSCVVCVYHWQSLRERRLDMEDERKLWGLTRKLRWETVWYLSHIFTEFNIPRVSYMSFTWIVVLPFRG